MNRTMIRLFLCLMAILSIAAMAQASDCAYGIGRG